MSSNRRQAVALARKNANAPSVIASGYGSQAEQIIALAKAEGLYVHAAPELISLLMQLDLDEQVPPALYSVIAELFVWAQSLESHRGAAEC